MTNKNRKDTHEEKDLILRKHVGLIHCEGKLTLLQRKICNILIFNALDTIEQETHEITVRHLSNMVGFNSNDLDLIKQAVLKLQVIILEWNLLEDKKYVNDPALKDEWVGWNSSQILGGVTIQKNGVIKYSYSPQMRHLLSLTEIYGQINLFVQSKLKSSYALSLYENCVRFKNIQKTKWLSLQLFRSLMGISKEQYASFKELKRNVIVPALKEINQKSDIEVNIEYKKQGRTVTGLRFTISENKNYKPQFKKLKKDAIPIDTYGMRTNVLNILQNEFGLSIKQIDTIFTQYQNNYEYILKTSEYVNTKKGIVNKRAYFISALKNEYIISGTENTLSSENIKQVEFIEPSSDISKTNTMRKMYSKYKAKKYEQFLGSTPEGKNILIQFEDFLKKEKSVISRFYKKNGLLDPIVIYDFINFVEQKHFDCLPKCLTLEEYITTEAEKIEA